MKYFGLDVKNLLPSYLVVSADTVAMENEAMQIAKTFNPADIFYVKRQDGKKEIVVDDIENLIRQSNLSAVGDKKLFIIFNAETMNTAAQNKLLKTIEDTTNSTVLFLCANENEMLQTIKSRSVVIYPAFEGENQTLRLAFNANPDGKTIYEYARRLVDAKRLDDALSLIPTLTKPENSTLAFDALEKSIKNSALPALKKHKLYNALDDIRRNTLANCNGVNAFDLLVTALFD